MERGDSRRRNSVRGLTHDSVRRECLALFSSNNKRELGNTPLDCTANQTVIFTVVSACVVRHGLSAVFALVCLSVDVPLGRCVPGPMCPWSEMSLVRYVPGPICPWSDISVIRYVSGLICPWSDMSLVRYVPGLICPWSDMSLARYIPGPIYP